MIRLKSSSLLLIFVIILNNQNVKCDESSESGFFTVVGSNLLKLDKPYRASVTYQGYKIEKTLQIGIKPTAENSTGYVGKKEVKLLGDGMQNIDFNFNSQSEGDYVIEVKSLTGDKFESIRNLYVNTKKSSTFIQTDKSIYKPSDNVKFRVFILDADTKPFKFDSIEIFITDGGENRVKQYENVSKNFIKGVYQNDLQLSDSPVMGAWKIHVKVNGEEGAVKNFDVEEYVLPKFEFTIDASPDVNFKDGVIRATVKAKYTFGREVKGSAKVTAKVEFIPRFRFHRRRPNRRASKTVDVDGKKFVEFNIKNDLGITENDQINQIELIATFFEKLSGKTAKASAFVRIHETPYKMELSKSVEKIKLNLPFKVIASVKLHDRDVPVSDEHNPVNFSIIYISHVHKKCTRKEYPDRYYRRFDGTTIEPIRDDEIMDVEYNCTEEVSYHEIKEAKLENGIAEVDLLIKNKISQINVIANYLEDEARLYYYFYFDSEINEFIQAKLLTLKPKLKENLFIKVQSTAKIRKFIYQLLAKGSLVETKVIEFNETKEHIFEIKPQQSMLPKATILIYYISKEGAIISDKIEVEFGNELVNYVDLQLSTDQSTPGSNLTISIKTLPNSYVGLLGVDQSVLLLKKGNDIEQETVFEELKRFGDADIYNRQTNKNMNYKNINDFIDSNVIIFTNGRYPYEGTFHSMDFDFDSDDAYSIDIRAGSDDSILDFSINSIDISNKPVNIRKIFPECWIFENIEFNAESNTKTLIKQVPDTITSWIITGFSLDPVTGLGLTKQPSKLNVFQPFFVSTNLPYSIKRGEVVSIPIIVFNYLESDQNTVLTLFNNDGELEFVEVNDEENSVKRSKRVLEVERKKEILVKSNEGVSVPFMIRPLKAGHITIKVTAESQMAGDGVERPLKVEPEGVTQYLNEAVLIDLRTDKEFKKTIDIVVPQEAVPDSTKIEASAIGDILGPSIENLDKLIKLPYGCGEQNMVNFVPNIVVLDYLTNLNKLNPQINSKAKKYMETGYQKELTYKHDDGSYSAFGKSDESGSTWLTAFVAKSFNQAAKYISVDEKIIDEALSFLSSVQTENGSFPEVGHILSRAMQGGVSKGIALTAYTLVTFLEAKQYGAKYEETIRKALNYVIENLDQLEDNYSLAIANYALQLADHVQKNILLEKLSAKAENKDGMKFWTKEVKSDDEENKSWYYKPNSVNVEMSAYALQAYILADQDIEAVSIMKWLVSQRNENGGFQSTQDTVVGLQALSKLATKIHVADSDLQISVKSEQSSPATININSGNSLILQKHELPSNARTFEVSATGKGFSILQISYKYNLDNTGKFPRFTLIPKVDSTSNKEFLHLHVCTSFVPDEQTSRSNMAVMEVSLPSGFTYDTDQLAELMATANVKKVETKDGDTVIMIYFDDIGADEICPEFKAYRTHAVAKQKPAPVIVYDYYDNSRHARSFYNPPEISLCDICEGADECKETCESPTVEIIS